MNFKRISQKIATLAIVGIAALVVFTVVMSALIADSNYSASAEDGDGSSDVIDVYVDGGTMSDPYFQFYLDEEGNSELTEIDISNSYKFHRLNDATSHPFYVSDQGYEAESSDEISLEGDGSSDSGITGSESFTLTFNDGFSVDDTLSYYCTVHSGMFADFTLVETVELPNIPATAVSTGEHASLVAALTHANLVGVLSSEGPYTVFAPTDAAFEEMGLDLSEFDTEEENETLAKILSYHVTMGSVMSSELSDGMEINSLIQEPITVNIYEGAVVLNGESSVTAADVETSNGVIHVIDKVLMPPSMAPEGPPGEICYDMDTHTVDVTKTEETCEEMWLPAVDIPTTAAATTVHDSLVAALVKANLTGALSGDGPFTVFAPIDTAFSDAGVNLDDFDTDEEITALAGILTYHVVSGKVMSTDLTDGMTATTLNGANLSISISEDGVVSINDAVVTIADVPVSNGVIHVIDKVLIPPVENVQEETNEEETTEGEETTEVEPTCDHVVGLDSSGYAYSPVELTISVGETVCWQWTDAMDSHNVAEIANEGDQVKKEGGVYSGAIATTVDFRHTFEEDMTFYYICEPHVSMDMVGKVVVGNGGPASEVVEESATDDEESSTPSLGILVSVIAMIAVTLFARRL